MTFRSPTRPSILLLLVVAGWLGAGVPVGHAAELAEDDHAYAEIEVGFSATDDLKVRGSGISGKLDTDSGFAVGVSAGLRLRRYLRVEGHLGYRRMDVDELQLRRNFSENDGDIGVFSTLGNVYLDLPVSEWLITPFLGAGLGFAVVTVDSDDQLDNASVDDTDFQFAWNVMAGFAVPLTERLELTARYRFFATEDTDHDVSGAAVSNGQVEVEFESHEALAGLRYRF